MKRFVLTHRTMRCPLYDCTAGLTVCTDSNGYPSRRHLDVAACSLLPSTSFVPPSRSAYFPDMEPPVAYTSRSIWLRSIARRWRARSAVCWC